MGTNDPDITSIRTQLTTARWYLDATVGSRSDRALICLERACHALESARLSLARLDPSHEMREEIEREIASIREQLDIAGEWIRGASPGERE